MRARKRAVRAAVLAGLLAAGVLGAQFAASGATTYVQPNWFKWSKATLDVLIVPPGHGQIFNGNGVLGGGNLNELNPYQDSYVRATEESANDWDQAIAAYGQPWLTGGLVTNIYVVGRDTIPQNALTNPEIVITSDETKGPILGITFSTNPCLINNSKMFITSYTYNDMYNVSGHEYGHCLGLDHSFGTPDDSVIIKDIIYATNSDPIGSPGVQKHCPSNLNVKGVERSFGGLFGQTSGGSVSMASTSYQRISC